MAQATFFREFVTVPGTTPPASPVIPVNRNRVILQVFNNGSTGNVRVKFDTTFSTPANQIWQWGFTATPTAGTWTVTDWTGAVTSALTYNESSGSLQTALNLLAGIIAVGGCTVTGSMAAGFVVTAVNQVTSYTLPDGQGLLTVQPGTLTNNVAQQSAIQNILFSAAPTAGSFYIKDWLGNVSASIPYNANTTTILAAINALPAVNNSASACTYNGILITVTFGTGTLADGPVPLLSVVNSTLTNNAVLTNNVQTMFFEPLPLEGTYQLVFQGQTTAALAFNATAAQIQTAFTALSTVGAGNCVVTGLNSQSGLSFAFQGTLADAPQPSIVVINGPDSQYGAVNGGTYKMHAAINPLNNIQKIVPLDIEIQVNQTVPGIGPTPVTAAITTSQAGIAPAAVTVTYPSSQTNTIQTPGMAQMLDGMTIQAGQSFSWSAGGAPAVPIGQMFIIASQAGINVQINEG